MLCLGAGHSRRWCMHWAPWDQCPPVCMCHCDAEQAAVALVSICRVSSLLESMCPASRRALPETELPGWRTARRVANLANHMEVEPYGSFTVAAVGGQWFYSGRCRLALPCWWSDLMFVVMPRVCTYLSSIQLCLLCEGAPDLASIHAHHIDIRWTVCSANSFFLSCHRRSQRTSLALSVSLPNPSLQPVRGSMQRRQAVCLVS
jgi:hypothetical protein